MWRTLLLVMAAQREVIARYHHNVDALKSCLGIQGDDDPPTEVLDLFKEKLYDVQSTMNAIFLDSGGLEEWLKARACLELLPDRSQSAHLPRSGRGQTAHPRLSSPLSSVQGSEMPSLWPVEPLLLRWTRLWRD